MKKKSNKLLQLQKVDTAIQDAQKELQEMEERITYKNLTDELGVLEKEELLLGEKTNEANQVQDKRNGKLDILNQKIEREEKKLFAGTITNPKELAAIQQELKHFNNNKDELETESLEIMETLSVLEDDMNALKEKIAKHARKRNEAENSMSEKEKVLNDELDRLVREREMNVKEIDPELLKEYDDIRERKTGTGAAALVNGSCQACHVELPATDINDIVNNNDDIDYCPSCGRIIILKE